MSDHARLIGVDWGTSNLRVMLLGDRGDMLDCRADPRGAGGLTRDQFAPVLAQVAGDWLDRRLTTLVCGMAGARDRWIDAGYQTCPVALDAFAGALARPDPDRDLWVVPGSRMMAEGGMSDVMRGEETQVIGLIGRDDAPRIVVAPGTHSKWIQVEGGRIHAFRTFMTGELFHAIRSATILGGGMGDAGRDDAAFEAGVRRGLADPAFTAAVFAVRVERLADRLDAAQTADFLSGLLIGAEIAAQSGPRAPITLVGAQDLTRRYGLALGWAGWTEVTAADGLAATARGLWRIHQARTA